MGENNDLVEGLDQILRRAMITIGTSTDDAKTGQMFAFDSERLSKSILSWLKSKKVVRKAPEQTPPKNPYPQDYQSVNGDLFERYQEAQQDMLRANFIKTVPLMEV